MMPRYLHMRTRDIFAHLQVVLGEGWLGGLDGASYAPGYWEGLQALLGEEVARDARKL